MQEIAIVFLAQMNIFCCTTPRLCSMKSVATECMRFGARAPNTFLRLHIDMESQKRKIQRKS